MNNRQVRVAIIEDDPATRKGFATIIDETEHMSLSVAVASVEEFNRRNEHRPDVVLLDLWLRGGGLEGADAVTDLIGRGHRVLVVSMSEEELPVMDAISAGAHGYLTKEAEPAEILRAIDQVAEPEGTYYSPTVAGHMLRERPKLSDREREVLTLVARGETTTDIAERLHIEPCTVNGHLDSIRNKTGERRRAGLAGFAYELGLISRFNKRKR